MNAMPSPDDAGPVSLRVDFPLGAGRRFALLAFPLIAAPTLVFLVHVLRSSNAPSRSLALGFAALLLTMTVGGFLFMLRMMNKRPTAVEVREKGLVVRYGSRSDAIEWPTVRGVEQIILGMVPTYAVFFHGRRKLVVGSDDRATALAYEVVRKAGLRWIHEPFTAAR